VAFLLGGAAFFAGYAVAVFIDRRSRLRADGFFNCKRRTAADGRHALFWDRAAWGGPALTKS
jgi:hypothetical protein